MDIKGKKISVIGAGKSGIAAAELLVRQGASVLVSDIGSINELTRVHLQELQIHYEECGHTESVYDADFCVLSPGIPPHVPVVQAMQSRGIPLYSEIEIASRFCRARIVGITGTDGKTTTSTIVHRLCEEDGRRNGYRSFSVGNIGIPFSSMVMEMHEGDVAVVELSSYQLERSPTFRPDVSVITNITPDHLDRYGGEMQRYAAAKFRIYANQRPQDTLVYNADDALLSAHFTATSVSFPFQLISFGMEPVADRLRDNRTILLDNEVIIARTAVGDESIIGTSEFLKNSFRGRHNISNVLAAVAVARALKISHEAIVTALKAFEGVEHRQEFVKTINGVDWVNDSKATNLNAMRQALASLPTTAVLIVGGRDKGNDYATVADLVREKITFLIALGESSPKIMAAFDGIVPLQMASSLVEALRFAHEIALPGQTVLFSPACASFDMFDNFEDRGRQFKQCVHRL